MSESILITILNIGKDITVVIFAALMPFVLVRLSTIRKQVKETNVKATETHEQIVNHHGPDAPNMRDTQDGISEKLDWLIHTSWWLFKKAENNSERIEDIEEVTMPSMPMSRKMRRLDNTKPTRPKFMSTAVISLTDIPKGEQNG